jgi:hypothetical protein
LSSEKLIKLLRKNFEPDLRSSFLTDYWQDCEHSDDQMMAQWIGEKSGSAAVLSISIALTVKKG